MWTLALNVNDGVTALFKNNKLIFLIQEERLSRRKYDDSPYLGAEHAIEYFKEVSDHIKHTAYYKDYAFFKENGFPNVLATGARNHVKVTIDYNSHADIRVYEGFPKSPWTGENPYLSMIRKKFHLKLPELEFTDFSANHRNHVATGLINASVDDSAIIVIDSYGSGLNYPRYAKSMAEILHVDPSFIEDDTWEIESIWAKNSLNKYSKYYANFGSNVIQSAGNILHDDDHIIEISNTIGAVKIFEAVNTFLNFHHNDITKTMFLSAYGKENPRIVINSNLIKTSYPKPSYIVEDYDLELFQKTEDHSWHYYPESMDEYKKDLAYAAQEKSFVRVCELVQKTIESTLKDHIIMVGKINYNYRINYKLLKKFPHIKFYHDPISHCGGDIIGAFAENDSSKLKFLKKTLETLYLGPDISMDYENTSFKGFKLVDSTSAEIAELISKGNVVALFQGRSEFGANALGNRSILFDPTLINGRKTLDLLKNRKWFECYPASCLLEFAHEWFDMAGLTESPFMMYAVDVLEDKKSLIPNVVHKDGSCLLQTVTNNQNSNLYELLIEFNKIKNIPILLNTGFHLENEPLVESLKDAIFALQNLDISYLWLPDIQKLAIKLNN